VRGGTAGSPRRQDQIRQFTAMQHAGSQVRSTSSVAANIKMPAAILMPKSTRYNSGMKNSNLQEGLNARFRHVAAFAIAAVAIAALLRHTAHVYGGYSPADIRAYALMAIPLVAILLAFPWGKVPD
jgi:hypothetical protein